MKTCYSDFGHLTALALAEPPCRLSPHPMAKGWSWAGDSMGWPRQMVSAAAMMSFDEHGHNADGKIHSRRDGGPIAGARL